MTNWENKTLADLGTIVGGATPLTSRDDYYSGNISWITPKDLSGYSGRYISKGERHITQSGLDSCSATLLPKNSILFSSRAPIGYIAISENELCTNQGFKSIIPHKDTDYVFLYYLLQYNKNRIEGMGSGTTFIEVSATVMRGIEVSVPPLAEQKRIASILSSLDDKIENNNAINKNLEEQAQAIFKSWFIDFEPFKDGEFEDSELGKIPKGWSVGKLSNLITFSPKYTLKKGISAPYLDMQNVPTKGHLAINICDRNFNGGTKFTNGDTLLARITPCLENGKTAYVDFLREGEIGWGSTEYIVMRSKYDSFKYFTYYLARLESFRAFAIKSMTGTSGRQRASTVSIETMPFIIPPLNILESFNISITENMELIKQHYQENKILAKLRDSLLPKLMSGAVRVPVEVE